MQNRCLRLAEVNSGPKDARAEIALKIVSANMEGAEKNTVQKNICGSLWKVINSFPLVWVLFFLLLQLKARPCMRERAFVLMRSKLRQLAVLIAQVMILSQREIIPGKTSIADLIKSWPKVSSGSDRIKPRVFPA